MGMALEWKRDEMFDGGIGSTLIDNQKSFAASQCLNDFDIHQVWSVDTSRGGLQNRVDGESCRRSQQPLQHGRSVENDHRASRSRRMIRAADTGRRTGS